VSTIRPPMELKRYWSDYGIGNASDALRRFHDVSDSRQLSSKEKDVLHRTIEAEIVPRLISAHSARGAKLASDLLFEPSISMDEVEEFVQVLLGESIYRAKAFATAIRSRGVPLDIVLLWLFAPAARFLGELWKQDICDFFDVTIALSKLQQLLRDVSPEDPEDEFPVASQRRALLAAMPGDQHTFGVSMVQEFFRHAGWNVCGDLCETTEELLNIAHSEPFDLMGLSVSNDVPERKLTALIDALRKSAIRRNIRLMVGGRFFLENPHLATRIGADATASDGRRAVSSFPACLT
jgi:MerR family transcriptional regulator, light-induced transcriptional regulator